MTKQQIVTDKYALYNSDCMEVVTQMPEKSVDCVIYSPPFAGLYKYSSSARDFSNCATKEEFLRQYEYLIIELARVTKPGRINAVHVTDVFDNSCFMWDFPGEVIKLHEKHGFFYRNRITIWKEPLKVRMRTMVKSLMHKLIVEDSTQNFTAMPDYVLVFTRSGENEVPVTHPVGLTEYFGATPLLDEHLNKYGIEGFDFSGFDGRMGDAVEAFRWASFKALQKKWAHCKDPKENKLSHIVWQRYASSVWDDVRIDNVLPFRDSKEPDDEKHVHPLQLDVIDRLVELYSNTGEVVFTPFAGVGSEVYSPVSLGRYGVGVELKDSYYKQALQNLELAESRFQKATQQLEMF